MGVTVRNMDLIDTDVWQPRRTKSKLVLNQDPKNGPIVTQEDID